MLLLPSSAKRLASSSCKPISRETRPPRALNNEINCCHRLLSVVSTRGHRAAATEGRHFRNNANAYPLVCFRAMLPRIFCPRSPPPPTPPCPVPVYFPLRSRP